MPRACILAPAGTDLTVAERQFFTTADPAGFVLFARNCDTPDQVRALTADLRDCVGRADAPVLIDQEGGRIARLEPPHWPVRPAAARFGALHAQDPTAAQEAARLNARLLAADVRALGITVDCIPVLDVPVPGADPVIGNRAFSADVKAVCDLGQAVCEGLRAGGVSPVIKHLPGHGRAPADSHVVLPRVDARREDLDAADFVPFRKLNAEPWGMTAHVLYTDLDDAAASASVRIIQDIIRDTIGFDGLLLSDDIGMGALAGSFAERTAACLEAGCDTVLHCKGAMEEMREVVAAVPMMSGKGLERWTRAVADARAPEPFDAAAATLRLDELLAGHA